MPAGHSGSIDSKGFKRHSGTAQPHTKTTSLTLGAHATNPGLPPAVHYLKDTPCTPSAPVAEFSARSHHVHHRLGVIANVELRHQKAHGDASSPSPSVGDRQITCLRRLRSRLLRRHLNPAVSSMFGGVRRDSHGGPHGHHRQVLGAMVGAGLVASLPAARLRRQERLSSAFSAPSAIHNYFITPSRNDRHVHAGLLGFSSPAGFEPSATVWSLPQPQRRAQAPRLPFMVISSLVQVVRPARLNAARDFGPRMRPAAHPIRAPHALVLYAWVVCGLDAGGFMGGTFFRKLRVRSAVMEVSRLAYWFCSSRGEYAACPAPRLSPSLRIPCRHAHYADGSHADSAPRKR